MKRRIVLVLALVVIGAATWQVGVRLGSDAQGMALGMVFGALAGMPAAILVLAVGRMSERPEPKAAPEPPAPAELVIGGEWVQDGEESLYVVPVPASDLLPFAGDGERLNGRYWLGNYSSERQFRVVHVVRGW